MIYAKLSTVITVSFGPVLAADGTVSVGALAYTDFGIMKNGTDGALDSGAVATHKANGQYTLALTANDISAVGECTVYLLKATLAAPMKEITVLTAAMYSSLFSDSPAKSGLPKLDASAGLIVQGYGSAEAAINADHIGGTAQTARDLGASVLLASGQKVDVDTIKTNPVVSGGTVTFPTNKTLAATGDKMDLVDAPNATGIAAIVTAINSLATYGLTALNYLLVTTGIKTSSVPVTVATSAGQTSILNAVNAITTNTARSQPIVPAFVARPASGTSVFNVLLNLYNLQGILEAPDAGVTIHAADASGNSLDSKLGSTAMTALATGRYSVSYTISSTDNDGPVYFSFTWAIDSVAMADAGVTQVQDAESLSTLNAIYNILNSGTYGNAALQTLIAALPTLAPDNTTIGLIYNLIKASAAGDVAAMKTAILALNNLSAQNVRDAMKLAPSAGAPAAGSIDELLTAIASAIADLPMPPTAEAIQEYLDANSTQLQAILDRADADLTVNTATTPWQLVVKNKTTGAVLSTKNLTDATGAAVTSASQLVANQIEATS